MLFECCVFIVFYFIDTHANILFCVIITIDIVCSMQLHWNAHYSVPTVAKRRPAKRDDNSICSYMCCPLNCARDQIVQPSDRLAASRLRVTIWIFSSFITQRLTETTGASANCCWWWCCCCPATRLLPCCVAVYCKQQRIAPRDAKNRTNETFMQGAYKVIV